MNAFIITLSNATPENIPMLIKKELSPNNIHSLSNNYNKFCRNKSRKNTNDKTMLKYGKSKKRNYTNRVSECNNNIIKRHIYEILSESEINSENQMISDYINKHKKENLLGQIYDDLLKNSHYDNNKLKLKRFVNLWVAGKQLNHIRNRKSVKFNIKNHNG